MPDIFAAWSTKVLWPTENPEIVPLMANSSKNSPMDVEPASQQHAPWVTQPLVTRTNGPSKEDWEKMKDRIFQAYIIESQPLDAVIHTMKTEHQFAATRKMYNAYFSKWGTEFEKNKRRGKNLKKPESHQSIHKRTRRQVTHPSARPQAFAAKALLPLSPRTPEKYRTSEIVLFSANSYVHGLLDVYTWDKIRFIPPAGEQDVYDLWQQISDQCYGATMLVKSGKIQHGINRFSFMCEELRTVAQFAGPGMMVKLWPICWRLQKTCVILRDFQLFYAFLRYLRNLVEIFFGRTHPLFSLLDATFQTPPDHLAGLLETANMRTITAMEFHMGNENAVVLHMWSRYLHCFSNNSSYLTTAISRYEGLLYTTESQEGSLADSTLSVLHGFMYFTYYILGDLSQTYKIALKFYQRAPFLTCLQEAPRWCLATQGFALAMKLLGIISLRNGNRQECRWYMQYGINILQRGDQECQLRALMLSEILADWLEDLGAFEEAEAFCGQRVGPDVPVDEV